MNEVDLIIHYMRQSRMDAVRKELEKLSKQKLSTRPQRADQASIALYEIRALFQNASNNAPLP